MITLKKGFTLVELLAVIVILGTVMLLTIPAITNTGGDARNKLTSIEEKNLKEAGKMVALDLDDKDSDIYNCKGWINNCEKDGNKWSRVTITIEQLKSNGYFIDRDDHLNNNITITIKSDYSITINQS